MIAVVTHARWVSLVVLLACAPIPRGGTIEREATSSLYLGLLPEGGASHLPIVPIGPTGWLVNSAGVSAELAEGLPALRAGGARLRFGVSSLGVQTLGRCEAFAPDPCEARVERVVGVGLVEWWTATEGALRVGWTVSPEEPVVRLGVAAPDAERVETVDGNLVLHTARGSWVVEAPVAATASGRPVDARWSVDGGKISLVAAGDPQDVPWVIDPVVRPAHATLEGNADLRAEGFATVPIGDFNADGYNDFAVAADAGAQIVFGSASGTWGTPVSTGYSYATGVAGGDFDDDGYSDLVIGQLSYGVDIRYGAAQGVGRYVELPLTFGSQGAGMAVASGRINGDAIPDILTATTGSFPGPTPPPSGVVDGWPGIASTGPQGNVLFPRMNPLGRSRSEYGRTLSADGDVNGDGYDDVLISEYGCGSRLALDDGPAGAYLHLGGPAGPAIDPVWTWQSPTGPDSCDGYQSFIAPDLDGDGYDDLVVAGTHEAWWLQGGPTGVASAPMSLGQREPYCWYTACEPGWVWVSGLGDVNGDGFGDVGYSYARGIDVLLGGPDGPILTPIWTLLIDAVDDQRRVFDIGDINNDGLADILGSAPYESTQRLDYNGIASIWLGEEVADIDQDGVLEPADCEPYRGWAFPGAPEVPGNRADDNCDGLLACFTDDDGDGFGGGHTVLVSASHASCEAAGLFSADLDCWDANPALGPQAVDLPENEVDEDCDGRVVCLADVDGDGFGGAEPVAIPGVACSTAAQHNVNLLDCDDSTASVSPAAPELPSNGVDDDCDGVMGCAADADADGYGSEDPADVVLSPDGLCGHAGMSATTLDCDDASAAVHPGVVDVTGDLIDNDCDALADCLVDLDGDGFGNYGSEESRNCRPGYYPAVTVDGDCRGYDPDAYPGAVELPGTGWDEDCNGFEDCYFDGDGDGYGGPGDVFAQDVVAVPESWVRVACPAPYATSWDLDCNAADPAFAPHLRQPVLGEDRNCDGHLDCALDVDGDGHGDGVVFALGATNWCETDGVWNLDDCDDTDPTIFLGAPEVVGDTVDQDCDSLLACYADDDRDTWGSVVRMTQAARCNLPNQRLSQRAGDCGPTVAAVHPTAREVPGDGVDNDCDGYDAVRLTSSPTAPLQDRVVTMTITGAPPGANVYFIRSTRGPGAGPCPPALGGTCAGLLAPSLIASRAADATGRASVSIRTPLVYTPQTNLWLQAFVAGAPAAASNLVEVL